MRTKTVELDDETKAILGAGRWQGGNFFLPDGQLERPVYQKVDKALKALGGKWNRASRAHVFSADKSATMRQLLEGDAVEIVDKKKTLEQFFTPPDLAAELIEFAFGGDLRFAHVLEPSAGGGALIEAAFEAGANYVTAIECDPDLAHALQHAWGGHSSPVDIFQGDFLTCEIADRALPPVDVVLMNPPFSVNKDIRHVMHAWEKLPAGGKLGAIMSPHFTFASDRESMEFRAFMKANGGRLRLIGPGRFKSAGTGVGAVLVAIEKGAA